MAPTLLIDIGANIGVYAVHLAGVASLRRILAFEPAPESFRSSARNVALQERPPLQALNEALSDREGSARFAVFGAARRQQRHRRHRRLARRRRTTTIEVPTARLDDRVEAAGETFVAKIDVEGHELQVLAGAERLLAGNTGLLQIEAFRTVPELDARLAGLGYARIFRMKHDYYYTNLADDGLRRARSPTSSSRRSPPASRTYAGAPPPPGRDPRRPRAAREAALRRGPGHRRGVRPPAPRG